MLISYVTTHLGHPVRPLGTTDILYQGTDTYESWNNIALKKGGQNSPRVSDNYFLNQKVRGDSLRLDLYVYEWKHILYRKKVTFAIFL